MTETNRPHALYRFFDAVGALLYVGRTVNPGRRWKKHVDEKPWWIEVVTVQVEHFPSLEMVSTAEQRAIQTEHPRYNIVHARTRNASGLGTAVVDTGGEAVALGLRDGRCPIGIIKSWTDQRVELSLYSFLSGDFGYERASYPVADVAEVRYTRVLTPHEMRQQGYRAPENPEAFAREITENGPVWAMDPLARFQVRWQHRFGLVDDDDLARTVRIFGGAA